MMSSNNLMRLTARIGRDLSHQCLGKIDPPQEFSHKTMVGWGIWHRGCQQKISAISIFDEKQRRSN
jgi:hypothetical protein